MSAAPPAPLDPAGEGALDERLLGQDQLEAHAVDLARAHGEPSLDVKARPLLATYQETKRGLARVYAELAARPQQRADLTPAEEWLLDNAHVIRDQLREIAEDLPQGYLIELPRLTAGPHAASPRVYALALDFIGHTDGRVDLETLVRHVNAYQSVADLTIGELWAVPIMLRLGLTQRVLRLADQELSRGADRARASAWAARVLTPETRRTADVVAALAELSKHGAPTAPFLVQLLRCLREHDAVAAAFDWIGARAAAAGTTPEEITRLEHLRQAESQVSIGNAITSMRAIAALDWSKFFERTSAVESILRAEPSGVYALTDPASRDRYRHAVEDLAARGARGESAVAHAAVRRAAAHPAGQAEAHVGYWLVDRGRPALAREVGYRPTVGEWIRRAMMRRATPFYLGSIGVGTAAAVAALVDVAGGSPVRPSPAVLVALAVLLVVPCSEIALTWFNWVVTATLRPRLLSKLSIEAGVSPDNRTLVVVPALIGSEESVRALLSDLEVRALANPEDNLYFALLTDFPDADVEERPGEAAVLDAARRGVADLNAREPQGRADRFMLFHRRRRHNPAEQRWMGWERKRGKLEDLNWQLQGPHDGRDDRDDRFEVMTADSQLLRTIRYVLTLDADTQLPRGVASRLVATIAHPLNRPVLDAARTRVVSGHGVVQPRVGTTLASTAQSIFARVYGGRAGIDPYTTAVSDVYQDLFGEAVYCGKAIYDVEAFDAALRGRVPENRLLSHDLFEGLHARTALATDIELLDDQPSGYEVHAGRQHRWVRGDWQVASWLLPRVPDGGGKLQRNVLPLHGRWKILDNLRRSLLAPSLVALLLFGWLALPALSGVWTAVAFAVLAAPLLGRLATALVRPQDGKWTDAFFSVLWGDVRANAVQAALAVTLLFDQAVLMLDAIGATFYRLAVRRNLLEWVTASDAERRARKGSRVSRRMWVSAGATLPIAIAVAVIARPALPFALPLLVAWAAAPFVADWISRPIPPPERPVSVADRALLRRVARQTWRFFETFVTAADHWLPPDNYQEAPKGELARRTSPTNIGLYLLSTVAARDFGYVTLGEVNERLGNTLTTIEALERHAGHVLNWYDTGSLRPLEPRYVSTVDSGNLAAHLWTVAQACRELRDQPIVAPSVLQAALDALGLFRESLAAARAEDAAAPAAAFPPALQEKLDALCAAIVSAQAAPPETTTGWLALLDDLAGRGEPLAAWGRTLLPDAPMTPAHAHASACSPEGSAAAWSETAVRGPAEAAAELRRLAPWSASLATAPSALTITHAARFAPLAAALDACPIPAHVAEQGSRALATIEALEKALRAAAPGATPAAPTTPAEPAERAAALQWLAELRVHLELAAEHAAAILERLDGNGARAGEIADGMRFRMLYDEDRKLFSIGYDVVAGRLDPSHYDLLASEARLASLLAIAKGDVPQEHWFRLGRQLVLAADHRALLSWSGSMFEFLMPLLVTRTYARTLLDETYATVVRRQREYGAQTGRPWGVSESAYNMLDLRLVYQYRAFGVPGLGLKAGLGEELVVAPYASVLAALIRPDLASKNLRALAKAGLDGPFGFYDAIDYTPAHVPPGRQGVVVKVFMAHHQGMSLVALDNVLNGDPMQRRFHDDTRVKATELLLQERVPTVTALSEPTGAELSPTLPGLGADLDSVEHVSAPMGPTPRIHLLAYGELSVMLTAAGSGWMAWKGLDVTRFRADAALDAWGSFAYLRDLDSGAFWSAAYQPTRRRPDTYDVAFAPDKVTIHRRDGDIETVTEIAVSPEQPAEVRRFTVTNHAAVARRIELTTYAEVVLAPRGADVAHPAFSSMFVETERVPGKDAVLAARRPRSSSDPTPLMVQAMAVEEGTVGPLSIETSRKSFVGRLHTLESPLALEQDAPLSGATGTVLDPVLCLRRVLELPPGGRVRLASTIALASTREAALELADTFLEARSITRTFELAWTDARVELRHLGISPAQASRFQRLASAVVFPGRGGLAAPPEIIARNTRTKEALWSHGISGDLPILLLRLDDSEAGDLVREVLLAHEFWRLNGLSVDLVILNEEPSSYLQPVQEQTQAIVRSSAAQAQLDQPGGVFVRRADQIPEGDRVLLQAVASVILQSSLGSLQRQLRRGVQSEPAAAERFVPRIAPASLAALEGARPARETAVTRPELTFWNGTGGFTPDGREYVMILDGGAPTPMPWCNVVATPRCGFMITDSGASYTWTENSQTHRLTPWSNDPVTDPSGEAFYLRDEEDGAVWSPTPRPAGGDHGYLVRHGQGYSTFEHTRGGLGHELTVLVAPDDSVKIWRLRLTNSGKRPRTLSVYGYVAWVLGAVRSAGSVTTVTEIEPAVSAVLARTAFSRFAGRVAFFAASKAARSMTADRLEFLGRSGSRAAPKALSRATLSGAAGAGLDPCAAIQLAVTLAPGATEEIVFVLGEGEGRDEALALARTHRDPARAQQTLDAVARRWDEILGAVQVKTPEPAFDLLVNRWLLYQVVSCRLWGRSAFYQSGGAFGFRDQLQDALATLHGAPRIAREQILTSAARQFREGDVQHWWHPESGQGVRTRCSDDLVWLPYVVAHYVEATGDAAILDEVVPFLQSRVLEPAEHELFGVPSVSAETATLYEHCARALDCAAPVGAHGLPKMGGGDWNDGMNRVGEKGEGESVWMAWFLAATLRDFAKLATARGDHARAERCTAEVARLAQAVDAGAWDGDWYRRAYFDDGTPLGSSENAECTIDAIAQSWAVIAGIGDPARARRAMRSTDERLVKDADGMILLFTPPCTTTTHDPGYIRAYPAGLRENGGQYTHGALWTVLAETMLGDGDRAGELWQMLSPIHHAATPADVARYQVEPYVSVADIYSAPGHVGRGGWTWYTGSAAWMYRIGVESMLGIQRRGDALEITPCIPSAWPSYTVTYRFGASRYHIEVDNPDRRCGDVARIEVDGLALHDATIPLRDDGRDHQVRVVLGAATEPTSFGPSRELARRSAHPGAA